MAAERLTRRSLWNSVDSDISVTRTILRVKTPKTTKSKQTGVQKWLINRVEIVEIVLIVDNGIIVLFSYNHNISDGFSCVITIFC